MNQDRWKRVEEIFLQAVSLPAEQRHTVLAEQCQDDTSLRREIEAMLAADADVETHIATSVSALAREMVGQSMEGAHFGSWRVVRVLGRGGMGAVYEAVREGDQFRQRGALKLLRQDLQTEFALARFRYERQILATLEHPNIARLIDGGETAQGQPYLVLELVDGKPVHQYAAEQKLMVEDRLRLFERVCAAVQYAHQKLVIHRDLKPGNILVTTDGVPKLLDFGIAKLQHPDVAPEASAQTSTGMRLLTPDYASPEQVRGEPVSTATDIYSLGAVLYELLTGRRPHRLYSYEPLEVYRAVCERDLERPSDAAPKELRGALAGDLDNILLKAMAKEPDRRYPSVEQLAADIRRYLDGRPVTARRDTIGYRAGKFARRHRWGLVAAALVCGSLAVGAGVSLYQARQAHLRFEQVRGLATRFLFEFHDEIRSIPGTTKAREKVVSTALEYLGNLSNSASGDESLQLELAHAYTRVGDAQGFPGEPSLGRIKEGIDSYRKGLAIYERVASRHPQDPRIVLALVKARARLGRMESNDGQPETARSTLHAALRWLDGLPGAGSDERAISLRDSLEMTLGDVYLDEYRPGDALRHFERNLEARRAQLANRRSRENRKKVCFALQRIGRSRRLMGNLTAALSAFAEVERERKALLHEDPSDHTTERELMITYAWLADTLGAVWDISLDDQAAAAPYREKALVIAETIAGRDPNDRTSRLDIMLQTGKYGDTLRDLDPARSVEYFRRTFDRVDALRPGIARETMRAVARTSIAHPLRKLGRLREARAYVEESIAIQATTKPDAGDIARNWYERGAIDAASGNRASAESNYRKALAVLEPELKNGKDLLGAYLVSECYRALAQDLPAQAADWNAKRRGLWEGWLSRNGKGEFAELQLAATRP